MFAESVHKRVYRLNVCNKTDSLKKNPTDKLYQKLTEQKEWCHARSNTN